MKFSQEEVSELNKVICAWHSTKRQHNREIFDVILVLVMTLTIGVMFGIAMCGNL